MEADGHADVLQRFHSVSDTGAYHVADAAVGMLIERSGRGDARDALGGPLMAMMRLPSPADVDEVTATTLDDAAIAADDEWEALDPMAEPALGALLALLVHDLLSVAQFDVLYEPFALVIPAASLD